MTGRQNTASRYRECLSTAIPCWVLVDSIEPTSMNGEHVIFTLDYTLESGDVVIVKDEYGDSMVKRYKGKDGEQYLISDNSRYQSGQTVDTALLVNYQLGTDQEALSRWAEKRFQKNMACW